MKKIISLTLVSISFIWIFYILVRHQNEILRVFGNFGPENLVNLIIATCLTTVAVWLLLPIFEINVFQNTRRKYPRRYLARLFFTGQIVSYLPGRFLGIAYLVNETRRTIPALTMVRINAELVSIFLLYNAIASVTIISFIRIEPFTAALVFLGSTALFSFYLRSNLFDRLLHISSRFLPQQLSAKLTQTKTHQPFDYPTILKINLILVIHWALYLWAWLFLRKVFIILEPETAFLLAATYSIGWIIGFITMITPGGWGVREATFVLLSSKFMARHHASALSLFLRIWLILIDLFLFLISYLVVKAFPCPAEGTDQ